MHNLLSKSSFISVLKELKYAYSSTGKDYLINTINSRVVQYVRESGSIETVAIDELYSIYSNCSCINTTIVRGYIRGRKYSPAVAILIAAGFYNNSGNRIAKVETNISIEKFSSTITKSQVIGSSEKDETRFFKSLDEIFPGYIISKSVNRIVNANEVFLNDDFRLMGLPVEVQKMFQQILVTLNSDFNFKGKSLTSNIDGLIFNHPILGNRIVEFDEEQHFSPARQITLEGNSIDDITFKSFYLTLLRKDEIFKSFSKKNRLKLSTNKHLTFAELIEELKLSTVSESGYVSKKNGFNYVGGRIAQRAYYDLLRDAAHLSSKNISLQPILRFPKVLFENNFKKKFSELTQPQIKEYTMHLLTTIHNYKG